MDKICNFLAKNASNHPNFGLEVYLGGLYWFPKFWKFLLKIARFLPKKPCVFSFFLTFCGPPTSHEKRIKSLKNAWIEVKTGINVPWGTCNKTINSDFWFFEFLLFYGIPNLIKRPFFLQKRRFLQKNCDFCNFEVPRNDKKSQYRKSK